MGGRCFAIVVRRHVMFVVCWMLFVVQCLSVVI